MFRYLICTFLLLIPYFTFAQTENKADEIQIKKIIKNLPEVKALDDVYDPISNRHQRVKMRIIDLLNDNLFYKVEVGYQGSSRFEPHYYFYINPNTKVILIEDLKYGDRTTLSQWRKRRSPNYVNSKDTIPLEKLPITNSNLDTLHQLPPKPKAEFIYKN